MSMILFFVLALFLVLDSLNNQQEPPTPIESRPVREQHIASEIPTNSEPHLTETNPVQEEPVCTETPVTEPIDTVPIAEYRPVESLESLFIGDSRTVDVHVKRLREKLEGVSESWSLKTVWGVGYKFEVL